MKLKSDHHTVQVGGEPSYEIETTDKDLIERLKGRGFVEVKATREPAAKKTPAKKTPAKTAAAKTGPKTAGKLPPKDD
jgi:hypothetical protein